VLLQERKCDFVVKQGTLNLTWGSVLVIFVIKVQQQAAAQNNMKEHCAFAIQSVHRQKGR
jgi:hypothetical protein